ncbi:glutathione S-transferase family protein [Pseudoalteromonas sp. OANN1]|uniref:glutathione S-transferase family protein n=1 Tax=Pseudoalteromonas sp. OANN1 TaxID=2954497 RepID=UPI0020983907|nr:glutathione S-transferase family protein [Pseudoalteromonas sp. OANN1]MCO7200655.1 glutathione S-transferase family protein [Pseudoalteromonas sp. OANN1]
MSNFTITTFDWVPELPRGYVRDIRLRWALEEAGIPYDIELTAFNERENTHYLHQPFGQVPWLSHEDKEIFESGAGLLYIAEHSDELISTENSSSVIQWLFAALNSVEMASLPWTILKFSGDTFENHGSKAIEQFLHSRLKHMNEYLRERNWLAEQFSVADIAMADVLRLVDRFDGLKQYSYCRKYLEQCVSRAAFKKAYKDQLELYSTVR